jgi:hypothetical protein
MSFMLLVAPEPVVGAPSPDEMAKNDATKKCAEFFPGDECFRCIPTDGWTSVGVIADGAVCPDGYDMTDTNQVVLNCTHLKQERCCGDVFSGAGNCEDLVINDVKKQCAFVNGGIASCGDDAFPPTKLPPGWTMQAENPNRIWLCPERKNYVWVDNIRCVDPCEGLTTCLKCLREGCCWPTDNTCKFAVPPGGYGVCPSDDKTPKKKCDDFQTLLIDHDACKKVTNCDDCLATSLPSNKSKRCRWFIFSEQDAGNCWAYCPGSLNCGQAERYNCSCRKITVDFDKAADGTPIKRGDYVTDQWKSLGLMLAASGTESSKKGARIFDTTNPGRRKTGDPDLGAPNKRCTPAGPGIGRGGEPGEPDKKGVNCEPQGNALIIQEDNSRPGVPNDNRNGGTITMDFSTKRRYVYEMGLLDIDDAATVDIVYVKGNGVTVKKTRNVPQLGDNSFQVFKINQANVKRVMLTLEGSGAVTFVSFCA